MHFIKAFCMYTEINQFFLVNLHVLWEIKVNKVIMNNFQFSNLPNLFRLDLTGILWNFKWNFSNIDILPKLNTFYLKNCSVSNFLPDFLLKFPNIQVLDLSYNNLSSVNLSKSFLNLRELILAGNRFQSLPLSLINLLPNLQFIDLSNNLIQNISFNGQAKLTRLDLSFNFIKTLSRNTFSNLSSLYSLNLFWQSNSICSII